jgi:hypothetical protein
MTPVLVPALEVGFEPAQPSEPVPPVAVQVLAPLVDQASVADCPAGMVAGLAVKELIAAAPGVGALVTLTTTELGLPAPPGPVQVKVKA